MPPLLKRTAVLAVLALPFWGSCQCSSDWDYCDPPVITYATVFYDRNDNGVQDPGEPGLPDLPMTDMYDNHTTHTDSNGVCVQHWSQYCCECDWYGGPTYLWNCGYSGFSLEHPDLWPGWTYRATWACRPNPGYVTDVFEDLNGDGIRQPGEPRISGWRTWLDVDDNGVLSASEPAATLVTASGVYLPGDPGHAHLTHVDAPAGWDPTGIQILPDTYSNILETHQIGYFHRASFRAVLVPPSTRPGDSSARTRPLQYRLEQGGFTLLFGDASDEVIVSSDTILNQLPARFTVGDLADPLSTTVLDIAPRSNTPVDLGVVHVPP